MTKGKFGSGTKLMSMKSIYKIIIIGSLISTLITFFLVTIPFPFLGNIQRKVWIGYFGCIFGSSIGGLITFLGVKLTQEKNEKNLKLTLNENNKSMKENNRLNVLPYLNIYASKKENSERKSQNQLVNYHSFVFKINIPKNYKKQSKKLITLTISLTIENIGIGLASNIVFKSFNGISSIGGDSNRVLRNLFIKKDSFAVVDLILYFYKEEDIKFFNELIINFYDIIGNRYEQKINIILSYDKKKGLIRDVDDVSIPGLIKDVT